MGWYFRRSVNVGPLRFNFSKSGVGQSFGIRGLRVGTGPRGSYVAGGRYGIYFRQYQKHTGEDFSTGAMTEVPNWCTHCGAETMPGNLFCIQCGAKLEADDTGGVFEPERPAERHVLLWILGILAGIVFIRLMVGLVQSLVRLLK